MDTLRDYIGWMGDYDFQAVPFGDVDALILCALSYYDFPAALAAPGEAADTGAAKADDSGVAGNDGATADGRAAKNDAAPKESDAPAADGSAEKDRRDAMDSPIDAARLPFPAASGTEPALRDLLPVIERNAPRFTALAVRDLDYAALLREAARSRRYGALRLCDCVDIARPSPPLQFSAMTFIGADGFRFIAYRGTDSTIAGWEEDFMISFTHTEAQELALEYARRNAESGRRLYLGGHSKGGNLALYAACRLERDLWRRVERVYMLDGPGLCPEVMDAASLKRALERTSCVRPVFSIVGKLFDAKAADARIARSSAFNLLQHSPGSWGVDHGRLALAAEHDPLSRRINETLQLWIDNIPQRDRAVFVKELFAALSADGATTLTDLSRAGLAGILAVLHRMRASSRVTRVTAAELPLRALLGEYYDDLVGRGLLARLGRSGEERGAEERPADVEAPEDLHKTD